MTNPSFMQQALEQARKAAERDEVPIGAVVVCDHRIIGSSGNRIIELSDPTAHAELLAIRQACETLGTPRLIDCDLYVTLEPCAMCAAAISFARIKRLYYGASDPKGGGVEQGARVFSQPTCHHKPEVYGGIAGQESGEILKVFFQNRR